MHVYCRKIKYIEIYWSKIKDLLHSYSKLFYVSLLLCLISFPKRELLLILWGISFLMAFICLCVCIYIYLYICICFTWIFVITNYHLILHSINTCFCHYTHTYVVVRLYVFFSHFSIRLAFYYWLWILTFCGLYSSITFFNSVICLFSWSMVLRHAKI